MDTLVKSAKPSQAKSKSVISADLLQRAEENRFAVISMLLIVLGSCGGLSAAFGSNSNVLEIAATVLPTIMSLALMLAVAPMRAILTLSAVALLFDLLVLLF